MAKSKYDKLRAEIKSDLLEQIERNGTYGKYYVDLIEDYMSLWDAKNGLVEDIRTRGVTVDYISNTGQTNVKKNESVGELVKVNSQMTKLLDSIGISPAQVDADDDDEM